MSVETVTMLVSTASILFALAGGFGWVIHRMDSRIDAGEGKLGARTERVADELVEVRIAVARIEGTPRHLIRGW